MPKLRDRSIAQPKGDWRMKKTMLTGAVLATAVAMMLTTTAVKAADDSGSPRIKCVGGNSCKGQSACKTASSDCKGMNACKGKGFVMTSSAKECKDTGGTPEKSSRQ
jgi:uncharacterized membrane protein